jgi:predicted DNA-binding transcriptional regulator YafY
MSDTLFKRIQILKLLPKFPARISTSEIHNKLEAEGFTLSKRTVQRDLNDLAKLFAIESDGNKDIPGWCWQAGADKIELPEMEPSVALTFQMVKAHLLKFMPPSVISGLSGYFSNADKLLMGLKDNSLTDWSSKIATLSRTQPLIAPDLDPEILSDIYMALLSETQITAHYQPKLEEPRDYTINPLGIVVVDQVIYLVGTLWEYKDIKQFALHRFIKVDNLESDIIKSEDFDLKEYIESGQFYFPLTNDDKTISLKFKANKWIAKHLEEVCLSKDQMIKAIEDSELFEISATVDNTQQLRWWLCGFGSGVEVLEPTTLRAEFAQIVESLYAKYQDPANDV